MNVFIDTSAFLAVLNAADRYHPLARQAWTELLSAEDVTLVSSNYVIVETTALLQHRFGMEAVRLLENDLLPVIATQFVTEAIHDQAVSALLAANRRQLSLVDCASFVILRELGLKMVFTFDPHFSEQGFSLIPGNQLLPQP
jgi:predicted nucleic acid-binding protein